LQNRTHDGRGKLEAAVLAPPITLQGTLFEQDFAELLKAISAKTAAGDSSCFCCGSRQRHSVNS